MMKNIQRVINTIFGIALLVSALPFAHAALDDLSVMALGPLDGRAVVKTADGKMTVLRVGDRVPGTEAIVKQVLIDKILVEELIQQDPPLGQGVWIYKAKKPGAVSRIQRLDKLGPPKKVRKMTVSKEIKHGDVKRAK